MVIKDAKLYGGMREVQIFFRKMTAKEILTLICKQMILADVYLAVIFLMFSPTSSIHVEIFTISFIIFTVKNLVSIKKMK